MACGALKRSGRRSGQRFDAEHGVATEALIFLGELDPEAIGPALNDATHYEPTPLRQFDALLAATPLPLQGLTLVDVGCGMGRVLLLATRYPMRQVVGVEVSPALCEVASANVKRWRAGDRTLACKDVRIVCADASTFRLPRTDAIFYLYNPFGKATLRVLVDRIANEVAGACAVLYHTPLHRAVLDGDERFQCAADLGFGAVYVRRPPIA